MLVELAVFVFVQPRTGMLQFRFSIRGRTAIRAGRRINYIITVLNYINYAIEQSTQAWIATLRTDHELMACICG